MDGAVPAMVVAYRVGTETWSDPMTPHPCGLCNDTVYDGEEDVARPDVHVWCFLMMAAMQECRQAMDVRRHQGLPTPTNPFFRDPNQPLN